MGLQCFFLLHLSVFDHADDDTGTYTEIESVQYNIFMKLLAARKKREQKIIASCVQLRSAWVSYASF